MADEQAEPSPFQDVGRMFPGDVQPCCVEPGTTVTEALLLMTANRYSQLPVVSRGQIRGVFSFWSLARHLTDSPTLAPHQLAVEDVMEQLPTVTVQDSVDLVLEHLSRHDAVLVVSPHGLQAVGTPIDALNYFSRLARPFVLLQEIELALRSLIDACVNQVELQHCVDRALSKKYQDRVPPSTLHEMTMEELRSIVTTKDNWAYFDGVLGSNRDLVSSKLEKIRKIRNDVFHFRKPTSIRDHETLVATRNWLFDKDRTLREFRHGEASP
jgi:CBS domain-containing protein